MNYSDVCNELKNKLFYKPVIIYKERENKEAIKKELYKLLEEILNFKEVKYVLLSDYTDPESVYEDHVSISVKLDNVNINEEIKFSRKLWRLSRKYKTLYNENIIHISCNIKPSFYNKIFKVIKKDNKLIFEKYNNSDGD